MTNAYDKITSIAVVYCTLMFGPDAAKGRGIFKGCAVVWPIEKT